MPTRTTWRRLALQRYRAAMLRALTATLTMTTLALAACGGGASEDLPPLTTAKGDGLDSYEVGDGKLGIVFARTFRRTSLTS